MTDNYQAYEENIMNATTYRQLKHGNKKTLPQYFRRCTQKIKEYFVNK